MFLKRFAAIVMSLVLLIQLTACKPSPINSSAADAIQSTSSQIASREETDTENGLESDNQTTDASSQDDSKDEIYSGVVSSEDKQDKDDSQQAVSKDKAHTVGNQDNVSFEQESGNNDSSIINCNHTDGDPYQAVSKAEFYANYKNACCNLDATYRSKHGFLSGSLIVPGQYVTESQNLPMDDEKYIRNTSAVYLDDGSTYVVMDADGNEAMRIHKAGGYITLEEVAAYMYAFGGDGKIPANYISKKSGKPSNSIWGEHLRVNHSYFKGDTNLYPYEPKLPDIFGCGGSLSYYEMDIGTTGTVTPGYAAKPYIQGNKINRGAARLVYARQDLNGNGVYENNEVYVFYTHNHYNDFREYLNYYGGWGEMFGNITGGGEYSSKTNANPTPYVQTAYKDFAQQ